MKKYYFLFCLMFCFFSSAGQAANSFPASISVLSPALQQQLLSWGIWHSGCPVPLSDLRLVRLSYYNFDGQPQQGEIILNKSAASSTVKVFKALYNIKFPFASIDTLINERGNNFLAEKNNITYGFICKKMADNKFSKLSYGNVITVNPVQNPEVAYVRKKIFLPLETSVWCKILQPFYNCQREHEKIVARIMVYPAAGIFSINRNLKLKGMAETAKPIFTKYGFVWSGDNTKEILWKRFIYTEAKNAS